MKGIKEKSDIVVGKLIISTRNCTASNVKIKKGTVGIIANLKGSQGDGFDFKYQRGIADVCIEYCGENPRFREVYKNEVKLYESF